MEETTSPITEKRFRNTLRHITVGYLIQAACQKENVDPVDFAYYIETVSGARTMYEAALRVRADFVLDDIADLVKRAGPGEIERAKLLQKHWMEISKAQSSEKYGERSRVDVTVGRHEKDLEALESFVMAKVIDGTASKKRIKE